MVSTKFSHWNNPSKDTASRLSYTRRLAFSGLLRGLALPSGRWHAAMTKGTHITAQDIKAAGDIRQLAKNLVAKIEKGTADVRDHAAAQLLSLATQNHGQNHPDIHAAKAVLPLVKLLTTGSAHGQESAAAILGILALGKADTQKTIVTNDGVGPLVSLLKMGSAKVQEVAASALAAIDSDISYQQGIIKAGAILPLVSMLKGGSAAAQAFAAQATANAAAFSAEAQRSIANAGSIPLLLSLLGTGKAQKPGACISGCGLRACPCACLVGLLT